MPSDGFPNMAGMVSLRVGSLFSGCGGMDLGLHKAGHRHVFFCEREPFRRALLARHFPGVAQFDDVHKVGAASVAELLEGDGGGERREALGRDRGGLAAEPSAAVDGGGDGRVADADDVGGRDGVAASGDVRPGEHVEADDVAVGGVGAVADEPGGQAGGDVVQRPVAGGGEYGHVPLAEGGGGVAGVGLRGDAAADGVDREQRGVAGTRGEGRDDHGGVGGAADLVPDGRGPAAADGGDGAVAEGTGREAGRHVDLLCGGFPCQDLSVAGRRAGLAGDRSGLFFEFMRAADELVGPGGFVLIENVPGLFSSNDGRDFAVLLATLAELGFHDLAWRVLDSRHFGVPQRRRRVFILARRASGRVCRQVLVEPARGGRDIAARRAQGARAAAGARGGAAAGGVAAPLTAGRGAGDGVSDAGRRGEDDHNLAVTGTITNRYGASSGQDIDSGNRVVTDTLRANGDSGGRYDKQPLALVDPLGQEEAGAIGAQGTTGGHRLDLDSSGGYVGALQSHPHGRRDDADSAAAGHYVPSREEAQSLTSSHGSRGIDSADAEAGMLTYNVSGGGGDEADLRAQESDTGTTVDTRGAWAWTQGGTLAQGGEVSHALTAEGFDASEDGTGRGTPMVPWTQNQRDEVREMEEAGALSGEGTHQTTRVYSKTHGAQDADGDAELWDETEVSRTLNQDGRVADAAVDAAAKSVRRLTPTECERLQGMPDGWTLSYGPSLADAPAWWELGLVTNGGTVRTFTALPDTRARELGEKGAVELRQDDTSLTLDTSGRDPSAFNGGMMVEQPERGSFNWQSGGDVRHDVREDETGALHVGQTPAVFGVGSGEAREQEVAPTVAGGNATPDGRHAGRSATQFTAVLPGAAEGATCPFDPTPDGPRYAALGDAVTAPVSQEIGESLAEVLAMTGDGGRDG